MDGGNRVSNLNKKKVILDMLINPKNFLIYLSDKGYTNWMSDEQWCRWMFKLKIGRKPNLDNPQSYTEKVQWLKLHDHNKLYPRIIDKYEVREYIEQKIGSEYLIPLIGVYNCFEDIDFESLPNQFVLKCTHDSGGVIICEDKKDFNIKKTKVRIEKLLLRNYFYNSREWPYGQIKPRLIIENYLSDRDSRKINDYKFFCFSGEVKVVFVASDRDIDTRFDYYDADFNHIPLKYGYKNSERGNEKPENFEEMKKIAEQLATDFLHVRVDLYSVNGKIYFGELTLYDGSGLTLFEPEEWDYTFGSWLDLSKLGKE